MKSCFKHYDKIPALSVCAKCEDLEDCQKRRRQRISRKTEKLEYKIRKKVENNYNGGVYDAGVKIE